MMPQKNLYVGIMSGTSLDGVDVALVDFSPAENSPNIQLNILHTVFLPYPANLRARLLALQHPTENELETAMLIGNALAKSYASAVHALLEESHRSPDEIVAIGCHGQTVRHRPGFFDGTGFTLQLGNPALLAELTNITVVADFRSRDIAAGGQGAPLVPAFHQAVFESKQINRALVNIGGIANITYLGCTGEVFGFDSGPGNMLLDAWIKRHQNVDYDADGAWAAGGNLIAPLFKQMLAEPYFSVAPPKSTGRDLFNDDWLAGFLAHTHYAPQDVARTLVALTAQSISDGLNQHCHVVDEIYVCGGGAHNRLLIQSLKNLQPSKTVASTDILGIGVDWVEAVAFAWLARQCMCNQTANLPSATGASGTRVLGAIYQR